MKKQVMKPFKAPRKTGDKTQVTVHRKDNSQRFKDMEKWMDKNLTGEGRQVKPHKDKQARPQPAADSEEP
jgi:hypothetical protein